MSDDLPNRHRRPNKVAKKYYFAPDVIDLIEEESLRTGYPRNVVLEILVREKFGRPPVEEASVVMPSAPKPERPKREKRGKIDIFAN
jgi:hypothetical protein